MSVPLTASTVTKVLIAGKNCLESVWQVTSRKDQEQYWFDKSRPYQYTSVKDFVEAFRISPVAQATSDELQHPYDRSKSHKAALSFDRNSVTNWEIFKISYDREWLLMKRNSFIYIFKTVQVL